MNIINGVGLYEKIIPSNAALKSLINSNFLGVNILRHSSNPFITIIRLYVVFYSFIEALCITLSYFKFAKLELIIPLF